MLWGDHPRRSGPTVSGMFFVGKAGNTKTSREQHLGGAAVPDQPTADRFYSWTRTSLWFVAVVIAVLMVKGLSTAPNIWPLLPLVPLPFAFLINFWLVFKKCHKAQLDMHGASPQAGQALSEAIFGLTLIAASGLVIALIIGLLLGRTLHT